MRVLGSCSLAPRQAGRVFGVKGFGLGSGLYRKLQGDDADSPSKLLFTSIETDLMASLPVLST